MDGLASCLQARKGSCHFGTGPPLSERSSLLKKASRNPCQQALPCECCRAAETGSKLIHSPVAVPDASQAALSVAAEKLGEPDLALRHPCRMGDCKRLTWCLAFDKQMYRL